MVLRPTGIATIGRSVLTPDVRREAGKFIIAADHKVHLLGYKLVIRGFPSMDQHRDIFGLRARGMLVDSSTLQRTLQHVPGIPDGRHQDDGAAVRSRWSRPSRGLALSHAERVFQEAGTYPVIVARKIDNPGDLAFYRQLTAYVDSGFPLFAAMHKKGHAMAVVGYEWRTPLSTGLPETRYSWDELKTLAVVDDNHLPYLSIPVDGGPYSAKDIDAFIVALPEKVFYPATRLTNWCPSCSSSAPW